MLYLSHHIVIVVHSNHHWQLQVCTNINIFYCSITIIIVKNIIEFTQSKIQFRPCMYCPLFLYTKYYHAVNVCLKLRNVLKISKWVIRSCTSNTVGQKKRTKVQTMIYKIIYIQPNTYKDGSIRTPHTTGGQLKICVRFISSCHTSDVSSDRQIRLDTSKYK